MGWPKKTHASGDIAIQSEYCLAADVPEHLKTLRAEKWLVLHVFWDGVTPGLITIISLRSPEYAPKPAKVKKAKEPVE